MISISESLLHHSGAQILRISTSKSRPNLSVFNDFDIPNRPRTIVLCKICKAQLQKVVRSFQFLTIVTSKSLSRRSVVQILATSWAADPPHPPVFRSWLSEPAKPQNYGKT